MRPGVRTVLKIAAIAVLGLVTGALASLAAIAFVDLVALLNDWLLISPRSRIMVDDETWLLLATLLVPALGGLAVGLLSRAIPERRALGPADVIGAVQGLHGQVSPRSGLLSAVSSAVSLGAGASVGQYGPLVHLGATLGSWLAWAIPRARWWATIGVGCGVASAISTAFSAPIAGIVFAHEVILRHYSLRAFAPITVAAAIGHVLSSVVFARPPLFRIDAFSVASAPEYLAFILVGIAGAGVAVCFMHAILLCGRVAQRLPLPACLKPMAAGAALGLAAIWVPDILGIGKETLRFAIIDAAFGPSELALVLVAKIAATALCIGFGFAGGVFSPALLVGILFGALFGHGAELVLGELRSSIAVYAICGMVSVASAVIGAPLTAILIVFELTRNYDLATAAMVSVVFSNLVSYRVFGRSLFDVQLKARGCDLSLGRDKAILDTRRIADYVTQDFTALSEDMSPARARERLLATHRQEGYVLDADRIYLGSIGLEEILRHEDGAAASQAGIGRLCRRRPPLFTATTTIWAAMEQMEDFVGWSIPVLEDGESGRMMGVVFEATVVKAYLDAMRELRHEENAAM